MSKLTIVASVLTIVLAGSSADLPADPPHEVFSAEVISVGRAPGFLCGDAMALQPLEARVTRPAATLLHAGDVVTIPVLVCSDGPNLRRVPGARAPLVELDPAIVKTCKTIAFDLAPKGMKMRLAFPSELRVLP